MEMTGKFLKKDLDRAFFKTKSEKYPDIQFHSGQIDAILGVPVKETEKALREKAREAQPGGTVESWSRILHDGTCTWVGLNPAQLQTPYSELLEILDELNMNQGDKIIDLGAGYGRMGTLVGALYPKCVFEGYEMARERVEVGNEFYQKMGLENSRLYAQNIASEDFELPKAPFYFIYDFGSLSDMRKLLSKLEAMADKPHSFSLVARGRGINALIQQTAPWLTINSKELGKGNLYTFKA